MILRSFCLAVSLLYASVAVAQTSEATAEVSDKTLKTLKALAWQSLPSRIVLSDRTIIEIDKSDPSKIIIPDADAREIIREARLTARAHRCDLQDLVIANRDALLLRERKTGHWTESQLQYINTLHLFTVQLLLGKVEAVDARPAAAMPSPVTCNEKEKQEISSAVEANEKLLGKS
jgi:hypothetical protein